MWGFQTNHLGVIYHKFFRREEPELCYQIVRIGSVKKKEQEDQEQADAERASRDIPQEPSSQPAAPHTFAHTINQGGIDGNMLVEKLFSVLSNRDLQSQTPIVQLYESLLGTSMEDILAQSFLMHLEQKELEQRQAAERTSAMKQLVMQALKDPSLLPALSNGASSSSVSSLVMAAETPRNKEENDTDDFVQAAAKRLARAQSGTLDEVTTKPSAAAATMPLNMPWAHNVTSHSLGLFSQENLKRNQPVQPYSQQNACFVVSPPPSGQNLQSLVSLAIGRSQHDSSASLSQGLSLLSQVSASQPTVLKKRKIVNEVVTVSGATESTEDLTTGRLKSDSPDSIPLTKRLRPSRPSPFVTQDNLQKASVDSTRPSSLRSDAESTTSHNPLVGGVPTTASSTQGTRRNSLITLAWSDAQLNKKSGQE